MPLYPDWINAENTIIWLVTFQIQIFKNKLLCLVCRFLLQNVFLKLINIFVFFVFILVDAVSLHHARSGSQSQHRIRRILPARGACHIIKVVIKNIGQELSLTCSAKCCGCWLGTISLSCAEVNINTLMFSNISLDYLNNFLLTDLVELQSQRLLPELWEYSHACWSIVLVPVILFVPILEFILYLL